MILISQYLLNGPNAYRYERMSGDELANIVICKRIRAIMVPPLFLEISQDHWIMIRPDYTLHVASTPHPPSPTQL